MFRSTLVRTSILAVGILAGTAGAGELPPTSKPLPEPGTKTAPRVTGLLLFKDRLEFPAGTMIEVTVREEGKRMMAEPIGRQLINTPREAPIPFNVAYNPDYIVPGKRYVLHARIFRERGVRYASVPDVPVITQGNPSKGVTVRMRESDAGIGETSY